MVHLTPEQAARHDEAERQPIPPHELKEWMSAKEKQDGEMLVEITGADFDHALRILRKHDGNMDKAADALLTGAIDDAEERSRQESLASIKQDFGHLFPDSKARAVEAPARSNVVIDLTGDDDDPPDTSTRFRATTRSPDPAWQMVRSNQQANDVKSEDEQLNQVIQASWNDFAADESDTIPTEEMTQREGGRYVFEFAFVFGNLLIWPSPIALRADAAGKAYAALVSHFFPHNKLPTTSQSDQRSFNVFSMYLKFANVVRNCTCISSTGSRPVPILVIYWSKTRIQN
jgi:hypothetical protein